MYKRDVNKSRSQDAKQDDVCLEIVQGMSKSTGHWSDGLTGVLKKHWTTRFHVRCENMARRFICVLFKA